MESKRGWSFSSAKLSQKDCKAKVCPTESGNVLGNLDRIGEGGSKGLRKMSCQEVGSATESRASHRRSSSLSASEFWRVLERSEGQQRGKGPSGGGLAESIRRRCTSFVRPGKVETETAGADQPAVRKQPEHWKSLVLQKIQSFEQIVRQRRGGGKGEQQPATETPAFGAQAPMGSALPERWADDLPEPGAQPVEASPEVEPQPIKGSPEIGHQPIKGSPEIEPQPQSAEGSPEEPQMVEGSPKDQSPVDMDGPLDREPLSPIPRSDDEASLSDESVLTIQSDVSQLDRSYSISLAELRECGLETHDDSRRDERLNHSASLASNMSSMSVVSLIPADELDRLLDEVRCLEEEALQCPEEVRVVVLHKEEGAGLGFSMAGGADHENKTVTAHKVFPHGLAAQEGTIEQGDEILSINGYSLKGVTHSEALSHLHKARPSKQAIVVVRKVTKAEKRAVHRGASASNEHHGDQVSENLGECITVELEKNNAGLGFSLDGGKDSSQGDRPLTIKKVFSGGIAENSGLIQQGDELLRVNGEDCRDRTCYEAWNLIKSQPAGPVRLVIRKNQDSVPQEQV
ncbi:pro-interleukin-16-like [Hemitrygon akajei]|uniref:pro-interleukin-16-like n=1 Tax=Hemitrygon akajei TaxID=2704970 RepID=UPI003BFA335E